MSILAPNSHILYRDTYSAKDQSQQLWSAGSFLSTSKSFGLGFDQRKHSDCKKIVKRDCRANSFLPDLSRPESVKMEPITDSDHLDQILDKATDHCQPIVIDWMATWCRKCIYIKPKLEKLAAEFDTKLKFYFVDVNNVPQALVKRGNVSKMPTIQIWKDGEMKEEVIGGHKAWLVLEEVREMVKKDPQVMLEEILKDFVCVTAGDTIIVNHEDQQYYIDVVATDPEDVVSLFDTDCELDVMQPLDYEEPPKQIKTEEGATELKDLEADLAKFKPFTGVSRKLDEKISTNTTSVVAKIDSNNLNEMSKLDAVIGSRNYDGTAVSG